MDQTFTYVSIMQQSLERKKKYLQDILNITKEQETIAKGKKFDDASFERTIDDKEILINNVNEIDKGFTSVYERVRAEVLENKEIFKQELSAIQRLIRECVDLGMEIETLEERNRALLEQAFARGFKGIRQAKQSKQVASKYYQSMSNGNVNDSILYDRKK